jgi:hypothetical protein
MMETRRRNLIVLGSAALVSLVLAFVALEQRAAEGAPHYTPATFLPGFAAAVKNAELIQVTGHDGAFDVAYTADKGWVLPQRGNYPADFDQVRHTLIGMATLETIAPKTARADWLHYLQLDTPPKGTGTQIVVKDKSGAVLGSVIAGNTEELGDPNGSQGLFVRRPGSNQAYLARTAYVPHGDIGSWLFTKVLTLGNTRLQEMVVTPLKGPVFQVSRASPSVQIYTLANAPKKGSPNSQMINSIPFAIANFSMSDAKPVMDRDFVKPVKVVARTFDGLLICFDLSQQGSDIWTRFTASTAPGAKPEIVKEAGEINARAGGFEFKMPAEKGNALLVDMDKIMTPLPSQQPPGGMPQFNMGGMPGGTTP